MSIYQVHSSTVSHLYTYIVHGKMIIHDVRIRIYTHLQLFAGKCGQLLFKLHHIRMSNIPNQ